MTGQGHKVSQCPGLHCCPTAGASAPAANAAAGTPAERIPHLMQGEMRLQLHFVAARTSRLTGTPLGFSSQYKIVDIQVLLARRTYVSRVVPVTISLSQPGASHSIEPHAPAHNSARNARRSSDKDVHEQESLSQSHKPWQSTLSGPSAASPALPV